MTGLLISIAIICLVVVGFIRAVYLIGWWRGQAVGIRWATDQVYPDRKTTKPT